MHQGLLADDAVGAGIVGSETGAELIGGVAVLPVDGMGASVGDLVLLQPASRAPPIRQAARMDTVRMEQTPWVAGR
jgi:hypothetical protein